MSDAAPILDSSDRAAIEALVYRYAECIDDGDFGGVADLFADAVVGAHGGTRGAAGRDQVERLYSATTRRYPDGTPRSHHVTTNLVIGPDGEHGATARSYFTVLQAVDGELALQPVIAGRYHDRFVKADDGWRFVERRMEVRLVGDLSHHLMGGFERGPS